ncbi:MAG: SIS domain-containing protein [Deltaproteobacteria bacterium]|nr:SIS domain-containing protein [Deltaproteobacteria bacterium]
MSSKLVKELLQKSVDAKLKAISSQPLLDLVAKAAETLSDCVSRNGLIMACGNGGSTCDAMHLTEELVARYKRERRGIKAMHLMDSSVLTCWANDYGFDGVFARQIETFGKQGDVLVAFSTSGNSKNILSALEVSARNGVQSILLSGKDGGKAAKMANISIVAPSNDTERIQEIHLTIVHIFCEIIERKLLGEAV